MWQAQNGSNTDMMSEWVLNTSYLIPDLEPLTTYSVTVHAINMVGRGIDSEAANITTDPTGIIGSNTVEPLPLQVSC